MPELLFDVTNLEFVKKPSESQKSGKHVKKMEEMKGKKLRKKQTRGKLKCTICCFIPQQFLVQSAQRLEKLDRISDTF